MDWNISWIVCGGAALVFGICNLVFAVRSKSISASVSMFLSMAFGMFSVLGEYQTVNSWIQFGELSFAARIVPNMTRVLNLEIAVLAVLNLFSLAIGLRGRLRHDKADPTNVSAFTAE